MSSIFTFPLSTLIRSILIVTSVSMSFQQPTLSQAGLSIPPRPVNLKYDHSINVNLPNNPTDQDIVNSLFDKIYHQGWVKSGVPRILYYNRSGKFPSNPQSVSQISYVSHKATFLLEGNFVPQGILARGYDGKTITPYVEFVVSIYKKSGGGSSISINQIIGSGSLNTFSHLFKK